MTTVRCQGRQAAALALASLLVATAAGGCDGCSADECSSNADCGPGQICGPDGVCIPDPGQGANGGAGGGAGGDDCPSGEWCGVPAECCPVGEECVVMQCLPICAAPRQRCGADLSVCCGEDEECVDDTCLPLCPAPRERCGEGTVVCCEQGDICFADQCTTPGGPCVDFADCEPDEYCEPTLGVCLPIGVLPDCEYHPPVGVFSPAVEWTFGPTTSPYVRARGSAAFSDICSSVGTAVPFADGDESVATVALTPLVVPFFDGNRTQMTISTNGWLTFENGYAGGAAPANTALPDATVPNLLVAPYWDDLVNVTACSYLDTANSRVVVQWRGTVKGTTEVLSFQAVVNGTGHSSPGDIEFIYGQLGSTQDGDGATVGIEDPVTGRGIAHSVDRNGGVSTAYTVLFRYVPLHNHVDALTPPAVFDLDFDGRPEVIVAAYDDASAAYSTQPNQAPSGYHSGVLTILNGEDGTLQARVEDPDGYLAGGSALAIGDIDGDGAPEIVGVGRTPVTGTLSYVKAFERDGTLKWTSDTDVGWNFDGWGGGVHIADLDADGTPEIFFGLHVYDNQGNLLWSEPQEYAYPTTTAADLDNDGDLELISDHSAWHHDHTLLWNRTDLSGWRFPSFADFDNDGTPEVALMQGTSVRILNGVDGTDFWGPVSLGTTGGGPLNIGDFDADGYPEIGTAGGGLYVVLDLQCTGTPLPADCQAEWIRWSQPSKDLSSALTGSSLFDFEGDGNAEVVYSDECYTRVYAGSDGTVLYETPNNTRTATEYPLVADVDGDNNAEIVIVANEPVWNCNQSPYNTGLIGTPWVEAPYPSPWCGSGLCGYRGLFVYGDVLDNWVGTRRVWSGHGYHITNIAGNGTIPAPENDNWLVYNNYRMNAQGAGVFNAPDLVPVEFHVEEGQCSERLTLVATVSNEGAIGVVSGVKVSFFKRESGGSWTCLGTELTTEDLLPGAQTLVTHDYVLQAGEVGQTLSFRVVVDSDCAGQGDNNECETGGEDNNEADATGGCGTTT